MRNASAHTVVGQLFFCIVIMRLTSYELMNFEIIGKITEIETIAVGSSIRILPVLRRRFGKGRWRKLKGVAQVRLSDGTIRLAEMHWFEAHGIGKRFMRIKRYLD